MQKKLGLGGIGQMIALLWIGGLANGGIICCLLLILSVTIWMWPSYKFLDKLLPILLTIISGLFYLVIYISLLASFFQSQSRELQQQLNVLRYIAYLFISPINIMQALYFFGYTYPTVVRMFMVSIASFFFFGTIISVLSEINLIARLILLSISFLSCLPFLAFCFWLYWQTRRKLSLFGSIMITVVAFQRFLFWALGISFANILPWWIDQAIGASIDVCLFAYFTFVYAGLLWYMVENDEDDLDERDPMWTLESVQPYQFRRNERR